MLSFTSAAVSSSTMSRASGRERASPLGGVGALNLYGRTPRAFDDYDDMIGLLFASHALVGAQYEHHADRALQDRDVIGQAKGILMERYRIDAHHAFAILVRASQDANRKLTDVAHVVAETGESPRGQATDGWVSRLVSGSGLSSEQTQVPCPSQTRNGY